MRHLLATLAGLSTSIILHRLLTTRCLAPRNLFRRHQALCTIEVNLDQNPVTQHHTHVCKACDQLVLDKTTPVSDDVQKLLDKMLGPTDALRSVMGMGINDQSDFMN